MVQRGIAPSALIGPGFIKLVILAGKRPFCAFMQDDIFFFGRKRIVLVSHYSAFNRCSNFCFSLEILGGMTIEQ